MRKVLVITYYWPPAGGPGVQRWLKFVKYLQDFNIEPIVYIPDNPHYPLVDESFKADIPSNIKIYKHAIFEPYNLASIFSGKKTKRISSGLINTKDQSFLEKVMLWIRGNLFIPDARKYWIKPSVRFLNTIIEEETIDTIITSGPPHSLHLIGLQLQKKLNVKWIADFRDPWTSIGYHKKLKLTNYAQKRHKQLETLVLRSADKLLVTSRTTKAEFSSITSKPIEVITNGYDNQKIEGLPLDQFFSISHIGSMLTGRNPLNLWKALSELIQEHPTFKEKLKLQFIGVVSDDVWESISEFGLQEFTEFLGYLSHEEAVIYQQKSQVLLLVEIDSEETKGIIPGKLFEYMLAERPILGIGPENWEVATMVSETKSGFVFNYKAHIQLKNVLLDWFGQYQNQSLHIDPVKTEHYSRRELTRKLAAYI
ncbi:glycosyltransferase family 4 protein [Maribacter sp. CXY002]|uniref:glycosyltransferase family 4 protein n=1 Tax=Maribacter luteocoastalis TaxID=3407671 RepID=UPI003B67B24D